MKNQIKRVVIPPYIEDKNQRKHGLTSEEVESVFRNQPKFFFWEMGDVPGENLYHALGQSDNGRYLSIFFIQKKEGLALVISARDMDRKDRNRYEKK